MATVYHLYSGHVKFPFFGENELKALRESEFAEEMYDTFESYSFGISLYFDNVMEFYYNEIYTGEEHL